MQELKLQEIASWCGAECPSHLKDRVVSDITTDSRRISPGCLFVALRGERFDGHEFIRDALAQGAVAAVGACAPEREERVLTVRETGQALLDIAAGYRALFPHLHVVGLTGSVGKTTTRAMTAAVLSEKYKTLQNEGNLNNHVGLPQTIFRLDGTCEAAVLEMGMNHKGEISSLTRAARPELALITNIGVMHIEHLGSREGIMEAKLEILEGLQPGGRILLPADEPMLWASRQDLGHNAGTFGIENKEADFWADRIVMEDDEVSFDFHCADLEPFSLCVPAAGKHNVYNALAAAAVGVMMGLLPGEIAAGLARYQPVGMRQRIYMLGGVRVIEDCYNAGPDSMKAALEVLSSGGCPGRRIAVLGDMLELGVQSERYHLELGRFAAQRADVLFVLGSFADKVLEGGRDGGMKAENMARYSDHETLVRELLGRVRPGDTVLFKASRGVHLERVLERFKEGVERR